MCEFSAGKLARKIYADPAMTLHEKQHAWLELANVLPDERVRADDIDLGTTEEIGLCDLLRAYVAEQRQLEEAFFADEPDVVYLAESEDPETGEWKSCYYPALSWSACTEFLQGAFACRRVEVTKYFPKQFEGGLMKEITAKFNESGALTAIGTRMGPAFPAWRDLQWQIDTL